MAAVHCSSESNIGTSEADHTAGEYIHENSVYAWAEPDYDEFEKIKRNAKPRLADDSVLTVRVQAWLDRFDAVVRARVKTDGKKFVAPKPKAIVYEDGETVNAWVSWFPACIGDLDRQESTDAGSPATDDTTNDAGDAGAPRPERSALVERKKVSSFSSYDGCLAPKNWPTVGDDFTSWWNGSKPSCTLTVGKNGLVVGGEGCEIAERSTVPARGVTWATGSGIHVTTRIVSELSEKAFAVVIAHELGHYYRAHGSSAYSEKYQFWYQRDVHEPVRPLPADDSAALESQVRRLSSSSALPNVPGQTVSGRTAAWFMGYGFRELVTPVEACKGPAESLSADWVSNFRYGYGKPSETERAAYLDFETRLLACAGSVAAPSLAMNKLMASLRSQFPTVKDTDLALAGSFKELIDSVDVIAKKLDAEEAVLREHLQKNHIGWYTTEQEADDMAMELATLAGMTPKEVLEGWIEAMEAFDRVYPSSYGNDGKIGVAQCKELYANDFMTAKEDGTKEQAHVPMGSLSDKHHSDCYRLFNLWRENEVHKYESAPAPAPLTPDWSEIQEAAKAAGNGS
ncbi:M48 family metalloprotease [Labilithrix luteola]|nr:M48 family metalloprotease [Labilithrix luteola]